MTWVDVAGRIVTGFFVLAMVAGLVAVLLERFITEDERDEQGRR